MDQDRRIPKRNKINNVISEERNRIKIFDAIAAHDKKPLPKELLAKFKKLCADQMVHNSNLTLRATFKNMKDSERITFGQASTVAPFMVEL